MGAKKNGPKKNKIVIVVLFVLGISLLLYPIVSNIVNSSSQALAIHNYKKELKKIDEEERQKEVEEAKRYNENLKGTELNIEDPYSEEGSKESKDETVGKTSPIDPKNIIGNVEIPRIGVEIPIYHGTSELVLQKGAGHIEGTSLPIGGEGTHTAITAHRGLPSSRLFRNLDKMEVGDEFYIHNMEGTIAYKVDSIDIVLPHETEKIAINDSKDYATLITCEPYMVNTHRLLVRGVRTEYIADKDFKVSNQIKRNLFYKYRDYIIVGALILFAIIFIVRKRLVTRKN